METKLVGFKEKEIRRTLHNDEWWFSVVVVDVVAALTDSADPKQYIKKMRQRDVELHSYWVTICTPLALVADDGKKRKINFPIPKVFFGLSNLSHPRRLNPLNAGWPRWVMSGCKRLKILNLLRKEPRKYTVPKGIPRIGLKSGYGGLPFEPNSPMNGRVEG